MTRIRYQVSARRALAAAGSFLGSLGFAATVAAGPPPTGGFVGQPLAAIKESGFFTWFNLAQIASVPAEPGVQVLSFKPTGEKFHDLTTVEIAVDSHGIARRMDLILSRSFIDSPADGAFARDIAKSFLGDVPPTADARALDILIDEIQYRFARPILMHQDHQVPALAPMPSEAYLVFAGQGKRYTRSLTYSVLTLENITLPNSSDNRSDVLRIGLSPRSNDA